MANIGQKDGVFHVRFRFGGKEFKKSLKTRDAAAAKAAGHLVELTIHRLHTGQLQIPDGIDPGDFVVSGGTRSEPTIELSRPRPEDVPSTGALVGEFLNDQKARIAPTYLSSQAMHLRHLMRHLGDRADQACDRVGFGDLADYLRTRLGERHRTGVRRVASARPILGREYSRRG